MTFCAKWADQRFPAPSKARPGAVPSAAFVPCAFISRSDASAVSIDALSREAAYLFTRFPTDAQRFPALSNASASGKSGAVKATPCWQTARRSRSQSRFARCAGTPLQQP